MVKVVVKRLLKTGSIITVSRYGSIMAAARRFMYIMVSVHIVSLATGQTTSWIRDCQLGIPSAVKQSTYLSGWRYSSRLRKFCSLPQVLFGDKVLCHSCSQTFWWQMFCCSWTTYLEQLSCQSATQGSQLHIIQETTENIHVADGLRCTVTFFIIAPYKYSFLLIYLLTHYEVNSITK